MQYELWRSKDEKGEMGQIYLINPKIPLDRVNRKDIMESGGVCVGQLESELDARQLMEGFTYYKSQTIWALREAFAGLDKKLNDTRPLSPAVTNKIKAEIMGFKEMFQIFEDIDMERAAAGDYALPEDKGVGSNGTL